MGTFKKMEVLFTSKTEDIESIFRKNSFVICDSSFCTPISQAWYEEGVYCKNSFRQIDLEREADAARSLEGLLFFLEGDNVLTAEGVPTEIARARDMIDGKIKFLREIKRFHDYAKRSRRDVIGTTRQEDSLRMLEELFHQAYLLSKRHVFSPHDRRKYDVLEREVVRVAEQTCAKVDFSFRYGERTKPKKADDLHTDEQIVAVAFYLLLNDEGKVGILTRDSDIKRITQSAMKCENLRGLKGPVAKNMLRIYYQDEEKSAVCVFDGSEETEPLPRQNYLRRIG